MGLIDLYIRRMAVGTLFLQHLGERASATPALDRFKAMLQRNASLVDEFNRYAASAGAFIYDHATRVEHESGYLRISYRTRAGRFAYIDRAADKETNLDSRYHEALTSARSLPRNDIMGSTMAPTAEQSALWEAEIEAVKHIKPPLAPCDHH